MPKTNVPKLADLRVHVQRYINQRGRATRYWGVYVEGRLLAVVLYRKGARAIADHILKQ